MPRIPRLPQSGGREQQQIPFSPPRAPDFSAIERFGKSVRETAINLKKANDSISAARINNEIDIKLAKQKQEIEATGSFDEFPEMGVSAIEELSKNITDRLDELGPEAKAKVQLHLERSSAQFNIRLAESQLRLRRDKAVGDLSRLSEETLDKAEDRGDLSLIQGIKDNFAATVQQSVNDGLITQTQRATFINQFDDELERRSLQAEASKDPSLFLIESKKFFKEFGNDNVRSAITTARSRRNDLNSLESEYNKGIRERALKTYQQQALRGKLDIADVQRSANAGQIFQSDVTSLVNMNKTNAVGSIGGTDEINAILLDLYSNEITDDRIRKAKQQLMNLAEQGKMGTPTSDGRSTMLLDEIERLEVRRKTLDKSETLQALRGLETLVERTLFTEDNLFELRRNQKIDKIKRRLLDAENPLQELEKIKSELQSVTQSTLEEAINSLTNEQIKKALKQQNKFKREE